MSTLVPPFGSKPTGHPRAITVYVTRQVITHALQSSENAEAVAGIVEDASLHKQFGIRVDANDVFESSK